MYARRFAGPVGQWFVDHQAHLTLECLAGLPPGATVLDVGGGHAQVAPPLVEAGYRVTVVGSDPSCGERLAPLTAAGRCRFEVADLQALPYDDRSFDAVTCYRLVAHSIDWRRLIGELCRVAREPGASWIIPPGAASTSPPARSSRSSTRSSVGPHARSPSTAGGEIARAFQGAGFTVTAVRPQFLLPMALYRLAGSRVLARAAEGVARVAGAHRPPGLAGDRPGRPTAGDRWLASWRQRAAPGAGLAGARRAGEESLHLAALHPSGGSSACGCATSHPRVRSAAATTCCTCTGRRKRSTPGPLAGAAGRCRRGPRPCCDARSCTAPGWSGPRTTPVPTSRATPGWRSWYWSAVVRRVDAVIHPSARRTPGATEARYPELARAARRRWFRWVTIAGAYPGHGHRAGPRAPRSASRTGAGSSPSSVWCGPTRTSPTWSATVRAASRGGRTWSLLVGGRPSTPELADEVRRGRGTDPRVQLTLQHVPDDEVQRYLRAADLVVLPFRDITNSASALLALSFDRPVLVPALGAMGELQALAGADWVRTYEGELTPEVLARARSTGRRTDRPRLRHPSTRSSGRRSPGRRWRLYRARSR